MNYMFDVYILTDLKVTNAGSEFSESILDSVAVSPIRSDVLNQISSDLIEKIHKTMKNSFGKNL